MVVRWRLLDSKVGRLLTRGDCCCNPDPAPSESLRQQCDSYGSQCLDSPGWLVRKVQLYITKAVPAGQTPPPPCIITAPCSDGELTTNYCLEPGQYDLQLRADVETLPVTAMGPAAEFTCPAEPTLRSAVTPAAVRRDVLPGRAVNLDGIVLGINARLPK